MRTKKSQSVSRGVAWAVGLGCRALSRVRAFCGCDSQVFGSPGKAVTSFQEFGRRRSGYLLASLLAGKEGTEKKMELTARLRECK